MNLVILGIFSFNTVGLEGAIVQSLSHGFVASALFVIIGVVYDRYRTRIVKYYGGLATVMPIYITIFLFLPWLTLVSLVRVVLWRVLILAGSFKVNTTITF
jgi:NADH:ubiquinone oxidoreductase subunit 4 (subunit M)